jgi:integrase
VGIFVGKLTAAAVRELRSKGRYGDGDGLWLDVRSAERRYWTYRFMIGGRARTMTFGSAEKVPLTEARNRAARARGAVKAGIDPLVERDRAKAERQASRAVPEAAAAMSFADAAEAYIAAHRAGWRNRGETLWRASLTQHVFPVFGTVPVDRVTVDDVLRCLSPLWTTRTITATILRSRIELVLDYSRARGWRAGENPAVWRGNLRSLLPAPAKVHSVTHRAALPWREAPALLVALASESAMAARCLTFLLLTAVRSGEARGCVWSELDLADRLWTLPARRTKANREHRVPLSDAALGILEALAALRTGELVFWGRAGKLSDAVLTATLRRAGFDGCSVHGLRSTFRDWCADHGHAGDVAEAALAHVTGSAVERSYRRSDLLERRRLLMQQWAAFLCREPVVVPLRQAG